MSNAPQEPLCSELKFAAVLDPPRSGVHAKCLRSLRGTKAIKKLVRTGGAFGVIVFDRRIGGVVGWLKDRYIISCDAFFSFCELCFFC